MMDLTGFGGMFGDDDDHEHDFECHVISELLDEGLDVAARFVTLSVDDFMALGVDDLDQIRDGLIRQCLTECSARGLAPVSRPACRVRHIAGADGQPILIEFHVSLFCVRMVALTDDAADMLEGIITARYFPGDEDA